MKINILIKDEQLDFLGQIISEHSVKDVETTIQSLVGVILDNHDLENVFGDIRCVGGCFSTDEKITVELDDDHVLKMKEIFKQYEFDDYESEEEELSKIVRSIINYADQEVDLVKIFS